MPQWFRRKNRHIPKRVRIEKNNAIQKVISEHCRRYKPETVEEKVRAVMFQNLLNMAAKEGIVILPPEALCEKTQDPSPTNNGSKPS